MFQIIGAMAEFERALIQEHVRAGLQNARAQGRRFGRPRIVVNAATDQLMRPGSHPLEVTPEDALKALRRRHCRQNNW